MAEGARLERVYTGNRIEGSNPSLSAIFFLECLSKTTFLRPAIFETTISPAEMRHLASLPALARSSTIPTSSWEKAVWPFFHLLNGTKL